MKFSYRWLCEYIAEPSEYNAAGLEKVCDLLTRGGIEVEAVNDLGIGHGKIVVGRAAKVEPHPDADKLRLVTVVLGEEGDADAETWQVVCGAPNVREGGRYPFAMEGATLPGGLTLKKTKIRGVESRGMLCSATELEWAEDADGILDLPASYRAGEPFDAVIETKVTPDRPDCLSLQGLARDIAAMGRLTPRFPEPKLDESEPASSELCKVEVEDTEGCPRYLAKVIEGVKVGPSPVWMQRMLESAGVRAINNIVDVTNYVMLETGHPLHGFDLDKLAERTIRVRRAKEGEELRLLDDTEIKLTAADLVIADAERAHVLAGVMGGEESEVSEATTNVLIECACFDPASIRRSSKRHTKSSESSYRFERGVNYHDMVDAINRAAELMVALGGGRVASGVVDAAVPAPTRPLISVSTNRCNRLLGTSISRDDVRGACERLGFEIVGQEGEVLMVKPPHHRLDVAIDADVFEEVARVLDYDNIPTTLPRLEISEVQEDTITVLTQRLRRLMAGAGFHETLTYSFTHPRLLEPFVGAEEAAEMALANPISPETSTMRGALVASLLQVASTNQRRGERDLRLFEVGTTFRPRRDTPGDRRAGDAPADKREATESVVEEQQLVAVIAGRRDDDWRTSGKGRAIDFYDVKGVAELVLGDMGVADSANVEAAGDVSWLHPGRAARWTFAPTPAKGKNAAPPAEASSASLGGGMLLAGQIHPDLSEPFELRDREVYVVVASLPALEAARVGTRQYSSLPRFPAVGRSIALVVEAEVAAGALEGVIRNAGGAMLENVRVVDVYRGEHIEAGKKSVAFDLAFRSPERSLNDDEVNDRIDKIVKKVGAAHGATLRA